MVPRKVSQQRPVIDTKVIQLEARTRAAKDRARRAKEQAKEARKLFKQAKKIARRAKDELHELSTKLKGLLGSVADKVSDSVNSGEGKRRKKQATRRPAVAVTRKRQVKAVAPTAKAVKPTGKRSAVMPRKAAKPVLPQKRAATKKRNAPVVPAQRAVPKRRVGSGPKPSRPEALPPAQPSEAGAVSGNEPAE